MPPVTVNVRLSDASTFGVQVDVASATVRHLKALIADKTSPRAEPDNQKIVYKGRILKDDDLLSAYGTWRRARSPRLGVALH
jgi:ubiquilin